MPKLAKCYCTVTAGLSLGKEKWLCRKKQPDGQALIYLALVFETGARTSELLALTCNDYDGKRLAINKSMMRREVKFSTKTNMAREMLLTQCAKAILRECPTRFKGLSTRNLYA